MGDSSSIHEMAGVPKGVKMIELLVEGQEAVHRELSATITKEV